MILNNCNNKNWILSHLNSKKWKISCLVKNLSSNVRKKQILTFKQDWISKDSKLIFMKTILLKQVKI